MRRWRQTKITTLLTATVVCASFAAGYRNGSEKTNRRFDELIKLIRSTVVADGSWEAIGGPSTIPSSSQNSSRCFVVGSPESVEEQREQVTAGDMERIHSQASEPIDERDIPASDSPNE